MTTGAGDEWSMYPGAFDQSIWGAQYGDCDYRDSSQGSPSPQYHRSRT